MNTCALVSSPMMGNVADQDPAHASTFSIIEYLKISRVVEKYLHAPRS